MDRFEPTVEDRQFESRCLQEEAQSVYHSGLWVDPKILEQFERIFELRLRPLVDGSRGRYGINLYLVHAVAPP